MDICDGYAPDTKKIEKIIPKQKIIKPTNSQKKVWTGYYFVNTGISDDPARNWKYNKKYRFISAGNNIMFIERLKTLKKDDKIFAYITGVGYVGYGVVEEEAVLVKDYMINNTRMIDDKEFDNHKWKKEKEEDIDEWIVKVRWEKVYDEHEAKWEKGKTKAFINNVCRLSHEATIKYLEKEFGKE